MTAQDSFLKLKSLLENRPAIQQAMTVIRDHSEIGIVLGDVVNCTLLKSDGLTKVEHRPAQNPDLIVYIRPESVEVLNENSTDQVAEIAMLFFKEYLAGDIRFEVPGRLTNLINWDYLEELRRATAPLATAMARNGITQVSNFLSGFRKMKG